MGIAPQYSDIARVADQLGFPIKGNYKDRHKAESAIVNLSPKKDMMKSLALAYYTNSLSVYFSLESILAHSFLYLFVKQTPDFATVLKNPSELSTHRVYVRDVLSVATFVREIFKNEFLPLAKQELSFDIIKNLLQTSEFKDVLSYDEATEAISLKSESDFKRLRFLGDLI
mmetsp:Transcript_28474/g.43054  ORF Transcript_28474/g.43054 Transcript_28474/m.43054 type:complete len:171 (-) Transcript_28474:424-936(-)